MLGANPGHTNAVDCKIRFPLKAAWRVSAAQLGAPLSLPAHLHPRVLSGGVLLVEMDAGRRISLVALDAATGHVRWRGDFPSRQLFPDAGLYPAVVGDGAAVYFHQARPGREGGWELCRVRLWNGDLEWEVGTLPLAEAMRGPAGTHTLFRPVVSSASSLLLTPDFFGRPPLLAFHGENGQVQWRSAAAGGDVPTVLEEGPLAPVALWADTAAGRPVLHTTFLLDGTAGPAAAGRPAGDGPLWTEGIWDTEVRWVDASAGIVGVSAQRLRTTSSWPSASFALSVPGAVNRVDWSAPGGGALNGVVMEGSLFTGQSVVAGGKRVEALSRIELATGHTVWARRASEGGTPLAGAPGVIMGRGPSGDLEAWSSANGERIWRQPRPGLTDSIIGDGEVVASYEGPHPTGATAVVVGYR